jgi:hypothetical protein
MKDWFNQPIPEPVKPDKHSNPCVALYGKGPEGTTCGQCVQIAGISMAKTFYKCRLRTNTHGAKSDHKLRYPTCGRFEQRENPIPLYDGRG